MKGVDLLKRILTIFFLVTSTFFMTSCQKTSDQDVIRVAEVTRSVFYAPFYTAIAANFFAEENIDISLTTTWGGDKTMTTLLSNGADVALVGSETTIYVKNQSPIDPAINFAALTQTDGTFLVARHAQKPFSWDHLKNSTFLGQRKGGMPQMVGEYVLKQHDIDPYTDLTLLQHIDFSNIASAYASGTGDYVQLFEPQATLFEQEGLGTIVASFGEESGFVPYTSFIAKQSRLNKHHDLYVRFTRALYQGQKFVQQEEATTIAQLIAPFFDDTPTDVLARAITRYKQQDSYAETPVITEDAWQRLLNIMDKAGELPEDAPFMQLVEEAIAKESLN
ncbi:ABC transporter substrate-binding protein [Shouchella lonarensis]|uniref:ABC transporter substrate-binding protein n=1 Tax=Shouchella lonarensis TaxID=1464122 RepID=UPI0015A0120C